MILPPAFMTALSDLMVNLSAGWFGAVLIVPIISKKNQKIKILILTVDLIFAILSFGIAVKLRSNL